MLTACSPNDNVPDTTPIIILGTETSYYPPTQSLPSSPAITPFPTSAVQLQNITIDLGGASWVEESPAEDGVWLNLMDIYALDQKTAFIYGSLGALRSLMLKTEDGGHSWFETMTSISGNCILFVSFVGSLEGWAATAWCIETIDQIKLFHTDDGGHTWAEISAVSMEEWIGIPLSMEFFD